MYKAPIEIIEEIYKAAENQEKIVRDFKEWFDEYGRILSGISPDTETEINTTLDVLRNSFASAMIYAEQISSEMVASKEKFFHYRLHIF